MLGRHAHDDGRVAPRPAAGAAAPSCADAAWPARRCRPAARRRRRAPRARRRPRSCLRRGLATCASPGFASVAIRASTVPTSTVSPTSTRISSSRPAAAPRRRCRSCRWRSRRSTSSASTQSPTCFFHSTTVPSATETPIWGIVTSMASVLEELTAPPPARRRPGAGPPARAWARTGSARRASRRARPARRGPPSRARRSAPRPGRRRRTSALASSTITTFEHLRTLARIASSSSGTSERRSSTSIEAPSRSAVASSAVWTIAP